MKISLLISIYITYFFYNKCGCIRKKCYKDKSKNEKNIEDEGVFNDTINIKQEKIEKTTLNIKEKFNEKEKEIFKEIADKNLKLDKNENIKIDEENYNKIIKTLENKEKDKTITEEQKQLLDKLNNIDEKNIEKEKEIILIPFIDNKENLSFVTKEQIITTIESAYDKSIKEEDKILKKNIIEAINVLDNEIINDNAKEQKDSLKFDSKSTENLYIFGIKIYDGNQVDYIYNKLFDFNNGENCYQIKMIKKDKIGSKNSDIKCQNLTDKEKIFNFTFKKKTNKDVGDYVKAFKFLNKKIETTHNVNNDFYLKNKDDDNFMLYVDSDAIFAEDPEAFFGGSFDSSSGGINVYTDILYRCFYDKNANCTYFFTINFARYKIGNLASIFNGCLKFLTVNKKTENDIEKKRLEILQNQGVYILEIKEQNDENVKEIYNELNEDTTLNNAFNSIKEKINNSKK